MKKPLLIVVIILAVLLALPVINLLRWTFQTKKPMGIIIVDKTVPTLEREKHKSFNWIITNDRFVKKENGKSFSYKKDYYGFVPTRPLKERKWDRNEYRLADLAVLPEEADALYITDTYGVFFNDWYQGINKSRRTRKLYGGLNNNDNLLIKEMKDRNKLVVLEYNCFDYPTAEYESFRIQERLNIKFSGWTGKYFSSLDTTGPDFPIWMTAMYRQQYKKPWNYSKAGIVILNEKNIIVLEEGVQLDKPLPLIVSDSSYCSKWDLPASVSFDQWFDIIDPYDNTVISDFVIETNSAGNELLNEYGLDNTFPAVIREPLEGKTYYFSGDFASTNIPVWTSRFVGIEKIKGLFYSKDAEDTGRFFWLYYKPLIKGIFNDYYETLNI
ncbi:MAG TPA: hypothetical protein PLR52_07695 [Bacteroidales bacterium]|nr:hypothetical protein [Bacteroidales bacterium]HPI69593.1 hypothetical protein [Bacteroidales bacterium]